MALTSKIAAFTILEVTVAMVISAVSISMAYTVFSILSKTYKDFDRKNEEFSELLVADKTMKNDFLNAQYILRTEDGMKLTMPVGKIQYRITGKYILRDQNGVRRDTFHMPVAGLRFELADSSGTESNLIHGLEFNTRLRDQILILSYLKDYSSENLVNDTARVK